MRLRTAVLLAQAGIDVVSITGDAVQLPKLYGAGIEGVGELELTEPRWLPLLEDTSLNWVADNECAGSVQLRLRYLEQSSDVETLKNAWRGEMASLDPSKLIPYELRVHAYLGGLRKILMHCSVSHPLSLYAGRDLPAFDSNGSLDPFLRVTVAEGIYEPPHRCAKTATRFVTNSPAWYQTLCVRLLLPPPSESRKLSPCTPQVHLAVAVTSSSLNSSLAAGASTAVRLGSAAAAR
jgi:hypothetical protein